MIVKKFDIAEEDNLIRDFEKETDTYINPEKQIKYEQELEYEYDEEKYFFKITKQGESLI